MTLNAFEKAMTKHDFPRDKWTQLISTKLTGKAGKVFAELSVDACLYYDTLFQPTEIFKIIFERKNKRNIAPLSSRG